MLLLSRIYESNLEIDCFLTRHNVSSSVRVFEILRVFAKFAQVFLLEFPSAEHRA